MSGAPGRRIVVVPDAQALAETAAQRLIDCIKKSQEMATVCLTGGTTPKRLYELLATPRWRNKIPWPHIHWFIGDERFVPLNDPLSNMGVARRIFLDDCAPPHTVHPIDTTATNLEDAAQGYERKLKNFQQLHRTGRPLFDVVLMGVGPDGHTASLFPGNYALEEKTRWVVGVARANVAPFVPRVSLTLSCLAQTQEMLFLVSGKDKREIFSRVLAGEDIPAGRAHAGNGETVWILDQAAVPEV